MLGPFDSCRLLVLPLYHITGGQCCVPNKKDFFPGKKYQKAAFVNRAPAGQRAEGAGPARFAYENRIHWLSGEAYANPGAPQAGIDGRRSALVCVRKPNSLAFRGGVRKPGRPLGRGQWAPAGFGLRTKTEFIGFQRRRTQTRAPLRQGAGGAGREEGGPAAKVRVRKPNSLAFMGGEREPGKSPGQIPGGPVAKVRARKPNSLAFTGGEREPGKSPGQIPGRPATKVRARKPNSLAFTGGERELGKSPGQIPGGPAAKVRARKPNSLAFTGGEREPGKSPGQIPGGPVAKVRARKPNLLTFAGNEREPWKPLGRIPGGREEGGPTFKNKKL